MFSGLPRYNCKVIEHQTNFPSKVNDKQTFRDADDSASGEDDSRLTSEQLLEEVDGTGVVQNDVVQDDVQDDVQLVQDTATSFDNCEFTVEAIFSELVSGGIFPKPPEPRKKSKLHEYMNARLQVLCFKKSVSHYSG